MLLTLVACTFLFFGLGRKPEENPDFVEGGQVPKFNYFWPVKCNTDTYLASLVWCNLNVRNSGTLGREAVEYWTSAAANWGIAALSKGYKVAPLRC